MSAESRSAPRFARQLEVDVDGLAIVTANVSAGGVQLSCPEMRYPGFSASVEDGRLRFRLRLPATRAWLSIEGSVRYANLYGDDYLVGIRIESLADDGAARWAEYIRSLVAARDAGNA